MTFFVCSETKPNERARTQVAFWVLRAFLIGVLGAAGFFGASGCKKVADAGRRSSQGYRLDKPPVPKPWKLGLEDLKTKEDYEDARQAHRAGRLSSQRVYNKVRANYLLWASKKLAAKLETAGERKPGFKVYTKMLSLLFRPDGTEGRSVLLSADEISSGAKALLVKASEKVIDAFTSRGEVMQVLVARAALHHFGHQPGEQEKRLGHVVSWLWKLEEATKKRGRYPILEVLKVLEEASQKLPAKLITQEIDAWAQKGVKALTEIPEKKGASPKKGGLAAIRAFQRAQLKKRYIRRLSFHRTEALLLAGHWEQVEKLVRTLPFPKERDKLLIKLMRGVLKRDASAGHFQALADYFMDEAPHVAEAVCRVASGRFPKASEPAFCLGNLTEKRDDTLRELTNLERAVERNPKWHEAWDLLAKAYLLRLHDLVARQDLGPVMKMLKRNIKLHEAAGRRWPTKPLKVGLAKAYFAAGRAHTNKGKMKPAQELYKKALKIKSLSEVHRELGELHYWKGNTTSAEKHFKEAVKAAQGQGRKVFWLGRVAVKLARCFKADGRDAEAKRLLIRSMSGLMRLVSAINDSSLRANLLVLQAGILDELGKRSHAVRLLRTAVDIAPERSATYADALSFTVARGLVDEALDLYSRALVREKVTTYQKAYATFWVLDLGRRCGVEKIRLKPAWDFLKKLEGKEWFHTLARWYEGETSDAELRKAASNLGERVEADFYISMKEQRRGNEKQAKALWKKVRRSMIYVFYEFRMADRYLKGGLDCTSGDL